MFFVVDRRIGFSKYVNNRITYGNAVGTLVDDHGNLVISDYAKANMFNIYYASVGTVDNGYVPDISSTNPSMCSILVTVNFEEADVISAIKKLKPNLSSGPMTTFHHCFSKKTGAFSVAAIGIYF